MSIFPRKVGGFTWDRDRDQPVVSITCTAASASPARIYWEYRQFSTDGAWVVANQGSKTTSFFSGFNSFTPYSQEYRVRVANDSWDRTITCAATRGSAAG